MSVGYSSMAREKVPRLAKWARYDFGEAAQKSQYRAPISGARLYVLVILLVKHLLLTDWVCFPAGNVIWPPGDHREIPVASRGSSVPHIGFAKGVSLRAARLWMGVRNAGARLILRSMALVSARRVFGGFVLLLDHLLDLGHIAIAIGSNSRLRTWRWVLASAAASRICVSPGAPYSRWRT